MTETPGFVSDPTDTREAIMQATYLALCKHGYANLTIQRIADEFSKSKSLLYHHYDGKDDLLLDFLGYMLEQFEERLPDEPERAEDQIEAIVDRAFGASMDDERLDFIRAMVELRAQAAHDENYRDHFTRSDEFFREQLMRIIRSGVEQGVFRDVDPERIATFFQTLMTGVMTQRVTTNEDTIAAVREEFEAYLRSQLLVTE